jgi:xanthine dehydrogenase accessory factor
MLFGPELVTGYLSGGCVEADVALHAEAVLQTGEPRRLVYGQGGPADVRLPCGGRIEVVLERIGGSDPAARRLVELADAREPGLWLSDGRVRQCLGPGDVQATSKLFGGLELAALGGVCGEAEGVMFRRFDPAQRLVVIGADPPALAMAALGAQLGMQTWLVRPKGPAAPPPLPGVRYIRSSPAAALAEVGLDPWTSVAVATHDAELDHEALAAALPSPAGYVGVLGSRRRLPERLAALRAARVSEPDVARLKAPIGLALAGKSPWEIAVSVIAEVVQTQRAREAEAIWPSAPPGLHALVLAAGQGSRWGGAKLLAEWNGVPLLHGALAAAFAAPVERVTVVTGAHADAVAGSARVFAEGRADGGRLRLVHAEHHAEGLSASLRCGLGSLPPDAGGALLFLGDMPRIPVEILPPLAAAIARGAPAAAPVFGGRRGHPVAVSRALFGALMELKGDGGAASVLQRLGADLVRVEAADDGVLFDVDRPADLGPEAALRRIS